MEYRPAAGIPDGAEGSGFKTSSTHPRLPWRTRDLSAGLTGNAGIVANAIRGKGVPQVRPFLISRPVLSHYARLCELSFAVSLRAELLLTAHISHRGMNRPSPAVNASAECFGDAERSRHCRTHPQTFHAHRPHGETEPELQSRPGRGEVGRSR